MNELNSIKEKKKHTPKKQVIIKEARVEVKFKEIE